MQGRAGETSLDQTKTDWKKTSSLSLTKPWEQLEHQFANEKDPEVKVLLQKAAVLKKAKTSAAFEGSRSKVGCTSQKAHH
eukprot:78397-Amphidinium_carterae.1